MEKEKITFSAVSFDEFQTPSYEEWKAAAIETLKGGDFTKRLITKTYEGIDLSPVYTKEDAEGFDLSENFPGMGDFLRGSSPAGYLGQPWAIAQRVDAGSPEKANALLLAEISRGTTAVNCKIGAGGIDIKTARDMQTLLSGIDLAKIKLHLICGESALSVAEFLCAFPGATGCAGADPVGTLAETGGLSRSLDALYGDMAAAAELAAGFLSLPKSLI